MRSTGRAAGRIAGKTKNESGANSELNGRLAWMGHKNIQHTVRYTELAPDRFKDFWRD